ncbi:DRTGG domain-containing protein, partial [Mesorhizobium japonicum]|uniref:DRTGG domain-containing protein n=1 Tax=Mesorhizobium japonicum TaxID=2066070 RepID=UPI003B5C2278
MGELRAEHADPIAIVVNRVDSATPASVAEAVRARTGLPTWALPEDALLTAPLLSTVLESAEAELVRGDAALLGGPVLGTVVAAMSMENVLPRLLEGAIVVVPGDRSDVLLGCVMAHASQTFPTLAGIILNGGFEQPEAVVRLLDGSPTGLPIARNALGTFDTAVRVTRARSRFAADSPEKYAAAAGLMERHVDLAELLRLLSVPASPVMTPVRFEQTLVERARAARKLPRHLPVLWALRPVLLAGKRNRAL